MMPLARSAAAAAATLAVRRRGLDRHGDAEKTWPSMDWLQR